MGGFVGASSLILVAPVLAYALGYTYFVSYFGSFGLDIKAVGIPIEHYFVQGVLSFLIALFPEEMDFFQFLPLLSTIVLVVVVLAPLGKLTQFRGIIGAAALVPLLVAAPAGAFRQGQADAEVLLSKPPVYLALADIPGMAQAAPEQAQSCQQLESGAAQESPTARWSAHAAALARANECGNVRLIWQDGNATTVGVRSCRPVGGGQQCGWQVFRVSAEQVAITAIDSRPTRGGQQ